MFLFENFLDSLLELLLLGLAGRVLERADRRLLQVDGNVLSVLLLQQGGPPQHRVLDHLVVLHHGEGPVV